MVTIIVSKKIMDNIISFYSAYQETNNGEYIVFFAKYNDINITVYRSKDDEENFKVFFSGKNALSEAKKWDENAKANELKIKKEGSKSQWIDLGLQIGSDEVGTGDFFGPVVVVASLVTREDITFLKNIGVDDSKRLTEQDIKRLGPILVKRIPYVHISLENERYNALVDKGYNMNAIKAILHNKVLMALHEKHKDVEHIYIDQFCEPIKYFEYLEGSKNILTNITFKTKGESKFPCVAVSSIIARYSFIRKMKELSDKYQMEIPFGASEKVDVFAHEFIEKYGIEELKKNVKTNFTNYKELITPPTEE